MGYETIGDTKIVSDHVRSQTHNGHYIECRAYIEQNGNESVSYVAGDMRTTGHSAVLCPGWPRTLRLEPGRKIQLNGEYVSEFEMPIGLYEALDADFEELTEKVREFEADATERLD